MNPASALKNRDELFSETINGQTVLMSPRPAVSHNAVITNLSRIFSTFLRGKRCRLFSDGVDVHLDETNTFVPDVMIVCDKSKIHPDGVYGAPDLVVEVLSPSSVTRDRGIKKNIYAKNGVREYWIADPVSKSIEVYYLQNGQLDFDHAYVSFPDWEWARMTDEEKDAACLSVKVSLYDDLLVDVREVFEDVD